MKRARDERRRAEHRALGLCIYCKRPAAKGVSKSLCVYHVEKFRGYCRAHPERKRKQRESRRAKGICRECSAPSLPNCSVCQHHRERRQFYNGKRFFKGSGKSGRSSDLYYPYDQDGNCSLLKTINNAVPRSLPESIRPEVCQEIAVAVLEGSIEPDTIASHVTRFVKAAFKRQPTKFAHVSLEWLREVREDCI